jgi:hypothetical protein
VELTTTIATLARVYLAIAIVMIIHEIGHFPKKIMIKWFPIPIGTAIKARFRYGGLIANVILFISIALTKPENEFIQLVGLVAWLHFILYCFLGSILPEKKQRTSAKKFYVYDDVPNKLAKIFIPLAVIAAALFLSYYEPILKGVIGW